MAELFNFNNIGITKRELMAQDVIEFNKLFSQLASKSRKDSKPPHCLYCQQAHNKFCNSHSVPASFLRNIAVDGKVYTTNKIIDLPLSDKEKGVGNSGTFQVICRKCDSEIFKEYENQLNYAEVPTDKMIAQIALKNHLRSISKRRFEIALYNNIKKEIGGKAYKDHFADVYCNEMLRVSNLDLSEYMRDFTYAKKIIERKWLNEHYLFYHEKLDYIVPIAFQGEICLYFDFNGNVINDIYNKSKSYQLQTVHIAIFPMEPHSVIMMFIKKGNNRFRQFYKQFNALELDEKLSTINFIIFSYSEDVFMCKEIHDTFIENENLKKVTGLTSIQLSETEITNNDNLKEEYSLTRRNQIPNLLLK